MKKTPADIIILYTCTKNCDQNMYGSWDMMCDRWTDGQTDRKSDIEVGAPPKNCWNGPVKKKIILIFTMLTFLKNIKKDTCSYHYQNLDDMIYSSQCAPPSPP